MIFVIEETCKKRWRNIRDQFKRCLNKRRTKSGQSVKAMKKYRYEEDLQFLIPYIQDRATISSIEDDNESTTNETEEKEKMNVVVSGETSEQIHESTDPPPTPLYQPNTTSSRHDDSQSASFMNKDKRPHNRINTHNLRSIRSMKRIPQKNASNTLMRYLIDEEKSRTEIDPIEAFFLGLIPTIKPFSPYYQHIAKGRFFSVIQELEYEQIRQSHPSSPTLQPPVYESSSNSTSLGLSTTTITSDESTTTSKQPNVGGNFFSQFSEHNDH